MIWGKYRARDVSVADEDLKIEKGGQEIHTERAQNLNDIYFVGIHFCTIICNYIFTHC